MFKHKKTRLTLMGCLMAACLISCKPSDPVPTVVSEETYAGGELGTTFNRSHSAYKDPTPAIEKAGLGTKFKYGEYFFERSYTINNEPFKGLGPLYLRTSCIACHPGYGRGKRVTRYDSNEWGNSYLLIVTNKQGTIVESLGLVPMTKAVAGFKPMIDESKVSINWLNHTDEWGNQFPDGETYSLIYPELVIPEDAFYAPLEIGGQIVPYSELDMTLEATIGIYGTGLLDAIPDDSLKAEYLKQESHGVTLNPTIWAGGDWAPTGLNTDGHPFRLDYALDASSTQGNVSLWEVTNVVTDPYTENYIPEAYSRTAAADPEVQATFYELYPEQNITGNVETDIYNYLTNNNIELEMSSEDHYLLNLWIRGLAVPAARDLDNEEVQLGRKLFREIGCAACHRPSWTTGDDSQLQDPYNVFAGREFPRYPNQKIWPYSDLVQHRLFMENDIRTGWCRTTPLWGKGLMRTCAGHSDRLHDCRARNVMEAIMWHGNVQSDARWTIEKFRNLQKKERDAIVKFIEAL